MCKLGLACRAGSDMNLDHVHLWLLDVAFNQQDK
jgi:hypothetical protein